MKKIITAAVLALHTISSAALAQTADVPFTAEVSEDCRLLVSREGTMVQNPGGTVLSTGPNQTDFPGGQPAIVNIVSRGDFSFRISNTPSSFNSTPTGFTAGPTPLIFTPTFTLISAATRYSANQAVRINGTETTSAFVDLTVVKPQGGPYPAGTYRAVVTVLCEPYSAPVAPLLAASDNRGG